MLLVGSTGYRNDSTDAEDLGQPTEFAAGEVARTFRARFTAGDSITWDVEGARAIASAGSPACSGRELTIVDYAPRVALFATDHLSLGDDVIVYGGTDSGSVVSEGDVALGARVAAGHIFAGGGVEIGGSTSIAGTVLSTAPVASDMSVDVAATRVLRASLGSHSLAWAMDFDSDLEAVEVALDQVIELEPGAYGDVTVGAFGQLHLQPGKYSFESLDVDADASLVVGASSTSVYVRTYLYHGGETRLATDGGLLLGYFGTDPAVIASSFSGAIIAPDAQRVLGLVGNSLYAGSFLAREVEVLPGTAIQYADQVW